MKKLIFFAVMLALSTGLYGQNQGDDCSDPIKLDVDAFGTFASDTNYTCGRGNNYDQTCLAYYDGGEDIIYQINVANAGPYEFILDAKGTHWTGMALGYECPPAGSYYTDCLAYSRATTSDYHSFYATLEAGTYYLIIDTWPYPDCISEFELMIGPPIWEYFYDCNMPYYVEFPDDAPLNLSNQSTCGLGDRYSSTCLGQYGGGEDMMFLIFLEEPGNLSVRIDPHGSAWTGIALGATCPPPGVNPDDCLAASTSSTADPHGFDIDLESGEYFLMIDTWPDPECIDDFDLSLNFDPDFMCGDANDDDIVNVSDAVYIINYIFSGGAEPDPLISADANCDVLINVSDAVWLINYVFSSAFIPCDTNGDGKKDCML